MPTAPSAATGPAELTRPESAGGGQRRVIVTRPAGQAAHWVQALHAEGLDAVSLPLIAIAPVADPAPLQAAWHHLPGFAALMFVSANAVQQFFAHRPIGDQNGRQSDRDVHIVGAGDGPRAWATGPGTRQALMQAGWPAPHIDAPNADAPAFDSEALWALVQPQIRAGKRVLIVRGGDADGRVNGRDWLASRLAAAGVVVHQLAVYRRQLPELGETQRLDIARWALDGSVWLFSSSEAISNLRHWLTQQDWRAARACVTHERIAQAAHDAGFGVVCRSRPALVEVIASIKSMQ